MREVDSIHKSEARLRQALRSLSASSPADAPPQIGEVLAGAFRRRHARRRAVQRTAMAAVICLVLALLVTTQRHREPTPATDAVVASHPVKTPAPPVAVASPLPLRVKKFHATSGRNLVPAAGSEVATRDGFVDLPSSDQAVRGEDLRVVRLQVTGRALQMVGAPVAEESADNRMLADFIVGQDGTPYAVRLVR